MSMREKVDALLKKHSNVLTDMSRKDTIEACVANREAIVSPGGALVTWTPVESTGRSPKDTVIVRRPESEGEIDWILQTTSPLRHPLSTCCSKTQ